PGEGRGAGSVRTDVVSVASRDAGGDRGGGGVGAHGGEVARMVVAVQPRGGVARVAGAFANYVEGADVQSDGRDCRGAYDIAAGGDRGRAQLGLSLLLAARFDVH